MTIRADDLVLIPIRPGPSDIDAAAGTIEIIRQTGRKGLFALNPGRGVGPAGR